MIREHDRVESALTPEEWEFWHDQNGGIRRQVQAWLSMPPFDGDGITERRQSVAALCLYGQPFGFTRNHALAAAKAAVELAIPHPFTSILLREIADRIAALLPPREAADE